MVRARDTFARAPQLTRAAPEPTSWLLARFQDHLNVGRRDAAAAILGQLRDELRLDALNLKALQVQMLATFNDWPEIVGVPGFANLVLARRTPATTALLLEALYRTQLDSRFEAEDQAAVEAIYRDEVRNARLANVGLSSTGVATHRRVATGGIGGAVLERPSRSKVCR